MSFIDPSSSLLATCGGDTVKLFDVSVDSGDPCSLSYSPSPGSLVNCVKWNHTNLVVASAGEDKKISLWSKNGQSKGTVPLSGSEAGDDLEVSWLKQHSAPISGVCFSPSSDKIITSVGLDKKFYTFDTGSRKPTSCIPYDAPFSSLAYRDHNNTLAAGSNSGRVVFYDVRGRPRPFTVLRAYNNSEVSQAAQQQGYSSFSLQLFQETLEETLGSVQTAIHEDVRNLHIELLRQFYTQEMEIQSLMNIALEKQEELMKEVQSLRKENT